ncbi:MAG: ferritin family protein [Methanosarcinaceae archaeon]|nr:ferritin family protein [Methanosarcinaceae archaeon]MDD4497442.1 ferritin family protein [Methanosarcinaceae archaeon]
MLSKVPVNLEKIRPENLNKEILRTAMIAELDAINMYEEMAALSNSEDLRKVLLDIAREEKIHVAMFETVLLAADEEFLQIYIDYALAKRGGGA